MAQGEEENLKATAVKAASMLCIYSLLYSRISQLPMVMVTWLSVHWKRRRFVSEFLSSYQFIVCQLQIHPSLCLL